MTIQIIPDYVPEDHPIRSHLSMQACYVTIHETGNPNPGADAAMHGDYMRGPDAIAREVLWHFTVDCKEIRQHLPVDEVGWHAADGYDGPGNRQSIAVELCVNSDGDFEATKRNAAMLVTYLYHTVPSLLPFPEAIVQHNHWCGKDCPQQIRATGGWDPLLALMKEQLEPAAPDPSVLLPSGKALSGDLHVNSMFGPVRAICEAMGFTVSWDPAKQQATIHGYRPIPVRYDGQEVSGVLITGKSWAPVRDLGDMLGKTVTWNQVGPAVDLTDKDPAK